MRRRFSVVIALIAAAALVAATVLLAAGLPAQAGNPCAGPRAKRLLCPNLRIGSPTDLYLEDTGGRQLLRATSDVESRGLGPMELRGRRIGPRKMAVRQRIYRAGGGHIDVPTRATLRFTDVGFAYGGSYWKVHQLARFELRQVGRHGRLGRVVRTGPKLDYCLRDLERTRPGRRSPDHFHYPGCNQDPRQRAVTLGTSIGWSDIYPADYDKQWIDVTGLRGCFAFTMTVDPQHLLFESNENDNTSQRLVRLPFRSDNGC